MKKIIFTLLSTFVCFTHYGQTWNLEDYSSYSTASSHVGITYPANWSKAEYYPDFSWDVIPQYLTFKSGKTLTDATYQKAANYSFIDVNGTNYGLNTWDEGMWYANDKLKSYNPRVKGSYYLNLQIVFPFYLNTPEFNTHPTWVTGEKLRDYDMYNHANADCRQFWVNTMLDGLNHPSVDWGFVDKSIKMASPFYNASGVPNDDFGKSLDLLYKSMPANKFLIGNTLRNESDGGNRSAMQVYDGSYLERWHQPHKNYSGQTEPEALAVTIQLGREALSKGKIIIMRNTVDEYNANGVLTNADYYVPLAAFLIMVEKNAFLSFQGSNLVYDDANRWYTKDLEFFKNYLGPPLGDPVKNGLVYTRSFENLDVYLNLSAATLEQCTATFTWKGKTGPTNVTGVSISPNTSSLTIGATKQLNATISPSNATYKSVTWTSNNTSVATVNSSGLVTAQSVGSATITATTVNGGFTGTCNITVTSNTGGGSTNLALNGIASQSSNYSTTAGLANLANDGNTDGAWTGGSVTHTLNQANAWWEVDLGGDYNIEDIVIYGRTDACCIARLTNYTVSVISKTGATSYSQVVADYPNPSKTINAGKAVGRIVRVQLNETAALALAEVQVSGSKVVTCPTFTQIEAENHNSMSGVLINTSQDTGGGQMVDKIHNGDWCMYSNIDLTCATSVTARGASGNQLGGNIEVRIDSVTGTLIGTIAQGNTGGWQNWVTGGTNITAVTGVHNVYLVFTGGSGVLFNLNWFQFSNSQQAKTATTKSEINVNNSINKSFQIYPNPATNEINIQSNNSEGSNIINIFNTIGQLVIADEFANERHTINISKLPIGTYIIKITDKNNEEIVATKFIKN